ncbi:OX2R protein, partial [Atractosteus spatula]|nr:OX2R protein [Atractosteus spatula]
MTVSNERSFPPLPASCPGPPDLLTWGGMDRAQLNASAPGASEPNGTAQAGAAHSDYEEEILRYLWKEYLFPRQYEWVLIAGYIFVFVVALAGNILGASRVRGMMREPVGWSLASDLLAFMNQAMAHCSSPEIMALVTPSRFQGRVHLCTEPAYLGSASPYSLLNYCQHLSLCPPSSLPSHSSSLPSHSSSLSSSLLLSPLSLLLSPLSLLSLLLSPLSLLLSREVYPRIYHVCFFLVTYLAPLCLMFMAYFQIFRKLWSRQIPGASGAVSRKWVRGAGSGDAGGQALGVERPSGSTGLVARPGTAPSAEVKQLRARRKTAKMLLVVLLVFSLCYLPISVLNVLKRVSGVFDNAGDREAIYAWFTFSHWLVYANSAANPIIYNFLSGKFRGEFKAAFSCCFRGLRRCRGAEAHRLARTTSQKSLTNGSKSEPLSSRVSEHVVLSSVRAALS